MNFEDLSPELQEKLKAAKTEEELLAIIAAEGIDLSEDQLKAISGGMCRIYCFADAPQPCVCYDDYTTTTS